MHAEGRPLEDRWGCARCCHCHWRMQSTDIVLMVCLLQDDGGETGKKIDVVASLHVRKVRCGGGASAIVSRKRYHRVEPLSSGIIGSHAW